jgi:hypothetical protein
LFVIIVDDSMDSRRRGAHHPVMGGSRHWPSIDANYERSGGGKAPAVRKQSQSSTNLVAAQSSAGVQSLQRLHRFSQQGTCPVPVGFSGDLIELGPESRNSAAAANSDIGLGLSSLSEEGAFVNHPGHLQQSTECHASSGRMRGHSVSSSSNSPPDFLSGRVPIQGSSKGEFTTCTGEFFFPCRLGGHDVTENYGGPPPPPPQMSGLPTLGSSSKRESQASEIVVYPADGNAIDERKRAADGGDGGRNRTVSYHFTDGHHVQDVGRKMDGRGIKDAGRGSMNSNSLNIKRQDHLRTDAQLFGSSSYSHHSARVDASSSRANSNQGLVDPEAGCSSSSEGLHSDVDHHLLRRGSSISGRMLENVTGGVFGKLRSSSYRSSACKRKSCTSSSVSGSLSCGSHGSLRNGFRESNGGRTAARIQNGMSRRTMGIGGCTSASDVVVSTSSAQAAAAGRSSGLPGVASGLEPVARRSTSLREALHSTPDSPHRGSRSGKSAALASSSAGKSSQTNPQGGGVGLLLAEAAAATLPSRTSFAQTLRRSVPMMQHGNSGSQRTVLSDCHMNPNERNSSSSSSSSSSSLVPNEILTASSTSTRCQSGSSSLVGGSRSGTSFSPRHRDTGSLGFSGGGERPSHRYLGRSRTHSVTTSVSSASQLGAAVATESSRLRNQELFSFNNLESMSLGAPALTESVPPARQSTSTTPSTTAAAPSSRVPHTPCSQRQGNSVHTVLTNNPAISAPGPSPLSPSPPPSSSLSSSSLMAPFVIDSLSSPTSHFQRSLLSRTLSPGGVQESRGFSSAAADSLLGMPFRGLQLSARNGTHPPHLVPEGLAEVCGLIII